MAQPSPAGIQNSRRQTRTVTDDFAQKNLASRIAQQRLNPQAANDNIPTPANDNELRRQAAAEQRPTRRGIRSRIKRTLAKKTTRAVRRNIVVIAGHPIAWGSSYLQLVFAIPALIFFSLGTVVGNAAIATGLTFSIIATIIALLAYATAITVFYVLGGIRIFDNIGLLLATLVCLGLDMAPIIQIVPWMTLWVLTVQGSTMFRTINAVVRA